MSTLNHRLFTAKIVEKHGLAYDFDDMESSITKPRLLLHVCCGVCSAYVPELLIPNFDVTVYYENSNIYPSEEFDRRQEAAKFMAASFQLPFIEAPYRPQDWETGTRGMESAPENGPRCIYCIGYRLGKTFEFAKQHHFSWVATTLSVSRRKNATMINTLGDQLAQQTGISFLGKDWKKNGGADTSAARAKDAGIYRQEYCGCKFSLERLTRKNQAPLRQNP